MKRKIGIERAHPAGALCAFRLPAVRQRAGYNASLTHTHTHTCTARAWQTHFLALENANKAFSKLVPNCNIACGRARAIVSKYMLLQFNTLDAIFSLPLCRSWTVIHDSCLPARFSLFLCALRTHVEIRVTRRGGREKDRSVRNDPIDRMRVENAVLFRKEKGFRRDEKGNTFEKTDKSRAAITCSWDLW